MVSGVLYVVGCGNSHLFSYTPARNVWAEMAPMPTVRQEAMVAGVGGILYVIGGLALGPSGGVYNKVEAFDPQTNSWSAKAPMPTARYLPCGGVIGGLIYVVGGQSPVGPSVSQTLTALEVYDPNKDSWATAVPMPTRRTGAACGVVDSKLYVVAGDLTDSLDSVTSLVQVYDPLTDAWSSGPATPTAKFSAAAGTIEDTLYVIGGLDVNDHVLGVNEAFSPFTSVSIEVKPGEASPTISLSARGVVPVAILGSATFDATTVDPTTVTLAGAPVALRGNGKPMTAVADLNGDGYPDLLLYFRTQKLNLTPLDPEAVLYGKTYSGQAIRGSDKVKVTAPRRQFVLLPSPIR